MQVILLERIERLGQMGDVVKVKNGFARNYLLPRQKALRATKDNLKRFETERAQLEARNLELKREAEAVAAKAEGTSCIILRQAGETGQLYGSVTTRDIADAITANGVSLSRTQIVLDKPIKTIGLYPLKAQLHPEVKISITVNVARNADEAERQARGEDVMVARTDAEEARIEAEALFEEGAVPSEETEENEA